MSDEDEKPKDEQPEKRDFGAEAGVGEAVAKGDKGGVSASVNVVGGLGGAGASAGSTKRG